MMFRIVLVQFIASLIVAAAAWAIAGSHAALSALLGALACLLPNGLFALNLALLGLLQRPHGARAGSTGASAGVFMVLIGEVCKVVLMVGSLALVVWSYKNVVWPALIGGVSAVLLVQPFALAWRQR